MVLLQDSLCIRQECNGIAALWANRSLASIFPDGRSSIVKARVPPRGWENDDR